MLASDITLDSKVGTDTVFKLVNQDQTGTRRLDVASTLALPNMLSIKHSVTGKAPLIIDRHLIQFSRTIATLTGTVPIQLNFTLAVPRDVAVTNLLVADVVSYLVDFLSDGAATGLATTANIDAILRGES